MRPLILLLGLAATVASAQQPEATAPTGGPALSPPPLTSTPPSPDEPEWATPESFDSPAGTASSEEAPTGFPAPDEPAAAPRPEPSERAAAGSPWPSEPARAPQPGSASPPTEAAPDSTYRPAGTTPANTSAPASAPARAQPAPASASHSTAAAPGPASGPSPAAAAPGTPGWSPPPTPRAFIGPAEPAAKRALRYSRLSAGEGGSLLVLTEALGGMVGGAMLGSSYDREGGRADGTYAGAMLGALTLGAAGTLYQYFVPVKRNEAWLAAGAATLGFTAGVSAANGWDLSSRQRALLALTTSQVGMASVLLLTSGGEDVSSGDTALIGMTSFYAFITTTLFEYIGARQSGGGFRFAPVLVAPAAGMVLGALLAVPLEIPPSDIRNVTLFPIGMGALALLIGSRMDVSDEMVAKTVLGTVGGSFIFTVLLTALSSDVPTQQDLRADSGLEAIPMPVVMPAGRGNASLAAGPGLFMRF